MDRAENITKLVIEAMLPAKLEYRAEQSNGECDFDIKYHDGRLAALETTSSVHRAELEMLAAIKKQTKGTTAFPARRCQHNWMITVRPPARVSVLGEKLDSYLSALENEGINNFSLSDLHTPSVMELCEVLGVEHGTVITASPPPALYLTPSGEGGLIDSSSAIDAGRREAWKSDNRKKLGGSGANERHLAVYIDLSDASAWTAMHWSEPPKAPPELPDEVTHIWLLAEGESSGECTVWRGCSDQLWQVQRLQFPFGSAHEK